MLRLLSTIASIVLCLAASAQGTCVINGSIADIKQCDGKKIKKVFLTRTNELGQAVTVAEAKLKKGKYTFKRELAKDEPALMYTVTGFGEGAGIELFVEAGEVTVNTESASQPCRSIVSGTPANDTYTKFKALMNEGHNELEKQAAELERSNGKEWCASAEGKAAVKRIESKEAIRTLSQAIRFLIDNNASPMTPYMIEHYLLHVLTPAYAEQMLKSVSTSLHSHPYYHSLRNRVLANNLKAGNEVPNITLPMLDGESRMLTDYRGKYVVLNFWASGCEKSAAMIAELKNLYNVIKERKEQFVIISFALESDKAAWKNAVESNGMNLEGWMHACDSTGAESPAAKLFATDKAPRIILIEPEGRAVSLNMDIDELVIRAEQILSGDLYYLDQEE